MKSTNIIEITPLVKKSTKNLAFLEPCHHFISKDTKVYFEHIHPLLKPILIV